MLTLSCIAITYAFAEFLSGAHWPKYHLSCLFDKSCVRLMQPCCTRKRRASPSHSCCMQKFITDQNDGHEKFHICFSDSVGSTQDTKFWLSVPAKALQANNPGSTSKHSLNAAFGCLIQWWWRQGKVHVCVDLDWLSMDTVCCFKGLLLFTAFLSDDYLPSLSLVHSKLFIKAFQSSISQASPWTVSLFWASLSPLLPFLWLTPAER